MKRLNLKDLRRIIKEEIEDYSCDTINESFWQTLKGVFSSDNAQKDTAHFSKNDSDKPSPADLVSKKWIELYKQGTRGENILNNKYFKWLCQTESLGSTNKYICYLKIADSSGDPDINDPFYKIGKLLLSQESNTLSPKDTVGKPHSQDVALGRGANKSAFLKGKSTLKDAGHLMKSFDDLARRVQTENLRRIIREIIRGL